MINVSNLSYTYQDYQLNEIRVLKDISLTIKEGEKIILLGINGSGKSTLLKILNGLLLADGEYLYKKEKVTKKWLKNNNKTFRKEVVFAMQDPSSMLFNPTVYDEIAFGLKQFDFDDVQERVHYWAKTFCIESLLKTSSLNLSGGQKQKVLLASLLAIEPKFLLMDEPTAHLDPPTTGWLVDFLDTLDITSVISTHNLSLGQELGKRAVVLGSEHTILYDGAITPLLEDIELLKKAQLVHQHKHKHDKLTHSHYHIHSWN